MHNLLITQGIIEANGSHGLVHRTDESEVRLHPSLRLDADEADGLALVLGLIDKTQVDESKAVVLSLLVDLSKSKPLKAILSSLTKELVVRQLLDVAQEGLKESVPVLFERRPHRVQIDVVLDRLERDEFVGEPR